MTTAAWNTVVDQSTDAAFRTWGSELSTKFAAVGMVQTADTGQINWTTVTRATTNTVAGYEIWRLSSSNLYFKIEYGSGASNVIPSFWITVGTGSNGSGTLTGQTSTRTQISKYNTTIASTSTLYQSFLCATANYFGLAWKSGSATTANMPRSFLSVMQTVDATGAASSVGYTVVFQVPGSTNTQAQCVATAAAVTGALFNNGLVMVPCNAASNPSNSLDGAGNSQAFLTWFQILGTTPMTPNLHLCLTLASDLSAGSTASMTLIGSTAHTYLCAANSVLQDSAAAIAVANCGTTMLWE